MLERWETIHSASFSIRGHKLKSTTALKAFILTNVVAKMTNLASQAKEDEVRFLIILYDSCVHITFCLNLTFMIEFI